MVRTLTIYSQQFSNMYYIINSSHHTGQHSDRVTDIVGLLSIFTFLQAPETILLPSASLIFIFHIQVRSYSILLSLSSLVHLMQCLLSSLFGFSFHEIFLGTAYISISLAQVK